MSSPDQLKELFRELSLRSISSQFVKGPLENRDLTAPRTPPEAAALGDGERGDRWASHGETANTVGSVDVLSQMGHLPARRLGSAIVQVSFFEIEVSQMRHHMPVTRCRARGTVDDGRKLGQKRRGGF